MSATEVPPNFITKRPIGQTFYIPCRPEP
jgi:hypothetical protein